MQRKIFLISFLIILFNYGYSQNKKVSLDETQATWLKSEFVDDEFLIQSYIPKNLKTPKDSLPVLFVLDAEMSFGMTYDIVRWLRWAREIPEVAIVGISYGKSQGVWWEKRSRDYSMSKDNTKLGRKFPLAGGGKNFIDFIEKELFIFISEEYNLTSSNKTIIGISLGGLICNDILFSKPNMFKGYIIAGPALFWNDNEIFKREKTFAEQNKELNAIVYTSVGSLDNKNQVIKPWKEFNSIVLERNYENLNYKTEMIENETHLSMFPAALTKGLKYVLNQ